MLFTSCRAGFITWARTSETMRELISFCSASCCCCCCCLGSQNLSLNSNHIGYHRWSYTCNPFHPVVIPISDQKQFSNFKKVSFSKIKTQLTQQNGYISLNIDAIELKLLASDRTFNLKSKCRFCLRLLFIYTTRGGNLGLTAEGCRTRFVNFVCTHFLRKLKFESKDWLKMSISITRGMSGLCQNQKNTGNHVFSCQDWHLKLVYTYQFEKKTLP